MRSMQTVCARSLPSWLLCIAMSGCGSSAPTAADAPSIGGNSGAFLDVAPAGTGGTGADARTTASGGMTADARATGTGGSGGGSTGSHACTDPAYVLPMNPSDAHDGVTLSGFYVDTGTWNAAGYQVSQTLYICDYDDWYVVANMNDDAHDGAVKTYPNVHKDFNSAPKISSFSTIASSFAHVAPHVGIYEFAYDIWLNGVASSGSTEVMIWTDNYHQTPSGSRQATVTFDGQSYDVYKSGSYIAFVATTNVTSGTVDLLAIFNYVIGKGWIPATSTVGAIDYGVELVSTGGADATFAVTGFSLTAQ